MGHQNVTSGIIILLVFKRVATRVLVTPPFGYCRLYTSWG